MACYNGFYRPLWNNNPKWMWSGDSVDSYLDTNKNKNQESHSGIFISCEPQLAFASLAGIQGSEFHNPNQEANVNPVTSFPNLSKNYTSTSEDLKELLEILRDLSPASPFAADVDVGLTGTKSPGALMAVKEVEICCNTAVPTLPSAADNIHPCHEAVSLAPAATSEKRKRGRPRKYTEKNGSKNAASKRYNAKMKEERLQRQLRIAALKIKKEAENEILIRLVQFYKPFLTSFEMCSLHEAFPEISDCFGNAISL